MTVVLTTLAATLLIQLGYFMWKLSADHEQPKIGGAPAWEVVRSLVSDWRWLSGFVATSLGWVLFVQATALGDISLVQPLMSAGDLLLVIMAVAFLKERLGAMEWSGVLLTVLGAVALAWEAEDSQVMAFGGSRLLILLGILLVAGFAMLLSIVSKLNDLMRDSASGCNVGMGARSKNACSATMASKPNDTVSFRVSMSLIQLVRKPGPW